MPADPYLQLASVGRCEIHSRLGEGGMGVVYRGRHQELAIDVAIKFLHPHLVRGGSSQERFFREARLAARLNHPGVVRVFDCGEAGGHFYIVMEFVEGQTLAQHLAEREGLPVARALQIAEAVASALGEAYEQHGVIHRDIKPANILLTPAGQPKLVDLGLAKIVAEEGVSAHTSAGVAMGTPGYMPPEQFADAAEVDHRADIFALGATLYHMLAGQPPFAGPSIFNILKQVEESNPPELPPTIPENVQRLVERMLAKDPAERYQSYDELLADLRDAQQVLGDPADPLPTIAIANTSSIIPTIRTSGRSPQPASPTENRVLLVVDVQNDFCPGGALGVPEGDQVVKLVNKLSRRFAHVVLTQDWHCEDHLSFASSHPGKKPLERVDLFYGSQILWPDHCVQGTAGAEFHPDLDLAHCQLVIRKGYHREIDSYSAFFENDRKTPTGLAGYFRERGLTRLFIAGLATDFCVAYSALDARRLGFEVTVIESACRGIDLAGSLAAAWEQMLAAGVIRA